jgi:hypothetical protein
MNKKYVSIGIIFIFISVWFYTSLSSFKKIPDSFPASIIVRDGIERSSKEVAQKLADDMGFDLEGSYKSGYTPDDVVEYLISQPHAFNITFYEGKYYEGRITVLHIIPFSVCSILLIAGIAIIIFKGRKK